MDERQHVGDHLQGGGLPEGPDVDALAADRVEQVTVNREDVVLASNQHRDLT